MTIIAGGGFARMAWLEAQRRTGWLGLKRRPLCREATAYNFHGSVDGEYYRILDNATAAFNCIQGERRRGLRFSNTWYL
jgi:hypothetical protein